MEGPRELKSSTSSIGFTGTPGGVSSEPRVAPIVYEPLASAGTGRLCSSTRCSSSMSRSGTKSWSLSSGVMEAGDIHSMRKSYWPATGTYAMSISAGGSSPFWVTPDRATSVPIRS